MNILIAVAHPDDETQGAGGAIAYHVACGDTVYGIYFTDGVGARYGPWSPKTQAWDIEAAEREEAAFAAAESLGFEWIARGAYPDNALDTVGELVLAKFASDAIADLTEPIDRVYCNYLWDGNQDHRAVRRAMQHVFRPIRGQQMTPIYEMEVPRATENAIEAFVPNVYLPLTPGLWAAKKAGVKCYPMELTDYPDAASLEAIEARARWHGIHVGRYMAEAFVCRRSLL